MENRAFEMSYFNAPITNKVPSRTVTLLEVAAIIKSTQLAPQTQHLRSLTDKASARSYKGESLPYVTPSGVFSYCNDQSLVKHSEVLSIDLDGVEDVETLKQRLIADRHFFTVMAFRSPSGNGVKWFIVIDLAVCDHNSWFQAVRNYLLASYSDLTDKMVDRQCKNISRACFLCFDPMVYVNVNESDTKLPFNPLAWIEKTMEPQKPSHIVSRQPPDTSHHPWEELAKARATTRELLRRGANIADDYDDYLRLGFALANGLGSEGRELYHQLCSQSSKYRQQDCERKWQQCLRQSDGRTTIATFYNMAKQAGVDLSSLAREFKPETIYNF